MFGEPEFIECALSRGAGALGLVGIKGHGAGEAHLPAGRRFWLLEPAHVPTLARTSAFRNLSMTSMNSTDGTSRMREEIEAIW